MEERKLLIFGVAINDANYQTSNIKTYLEDGSYTKNKCPIFSRWYSMIHRCYSKSRHKKCKTYQDCSVCGEWLIFSNFKGWMDAQDWRGKQIDKDLLVQGNKIYSPDNCVFVDAAINLFLVKRESLRGECPLGVTYCKERLKFCAKIMKNKKSINLGRYHDPLLAHRAWQLAKAQHARELILLQDDERVIQGLNRVIEKIQSDYDNGIETKTF